MLGGVRKLITTLALILLKILLTPPRICQQILPSLKGRVGNTRHLFREVRKDLQIPKYILAKVCFFDFIAMDPATSLCLCGGDGGGSFWAR